MITAPGKFLDLYHQGFRGIGGFFMSFGSGIGSCFLKYDAKFREMFMLEGFSLKKEKN